MNHRLFSRLSGVALAVCLAGSGTSLAWAETEGDWEYSLADNGATITAYAGSESAPQIPTMVGGSMVVGVSGNVFAGNEALTGVVVPEGVTAIGDKAFQNCPNLTSVTLPATLTSIGNYAFQGTKIVEVVIPDSVTHIGHHAFADCTALKTVSLGSGVSSWGDDWGYNGAFAGCTLLSSLTVPEGVASIGANAFEGCTLLQSVDLPATVTSVGASAFARCELLSHVVAYGPLGEGAFAGCTSLTDVTLVDATEIGTDAFNGCTSIVQITLPETLTSLGNGAFTGCTKLASITIPDAVGWVGYRAFAGDTQLASAVLGAGIQNWGDDWGYNGAFSGCTSLKDLEVRDGVASLPANIFEGCTALTEAVLPASITSIGEKAFTGCSALRVLSMGDRVTSIGDGAFGGTVLREANLSASLASIGWNAFAGTLITHVEIPDTVQYIGAYAFADCPLLESVSLGASVESWGDDWGTNGAFRNCPRLAQLTISEGVTSIGNYAFSGCVELTGVDVPITTTTVGEGAFQGCTRLSHASIARGVVGKGAFQDCASLADLSLGQTTEVSSSAFLGCRALPEVTLPESLVTIGNSAFACCVSLQAVDIPDSVTYLGAYAFADCTGLVAAVVGNNITGWGDDWGTNGAFMNDTALLYAAVSSGANSLGNSMFSGCTALSEVGLPETVVFWGDNVFVGCPTTCLVHVEGDQMRGLAESFGLQTTMDPLAFPSLTGVTFTVSATPGGTVQPTGQLVKVLGSTQAVTAIPDRGYLVASTLVNGVQSDLSQPIGNIQGDMTVEVTFEPDPAYVDEWAGVDDLAESTTSAPSERQTISIIAPAGSADAQTEAPAEDEAAQAPAEGQVEVPAENQEPLAIEGDVEQPAADETQPGSKVGGFFGTNG